MGSNKRFYQKLWNKFTKCIFVAFLTILPTISYGQDCEAIFIKLVKNREYKPVNNVIVNKLHAINIQYDIIVYIPTFCLVKKEYKSIVPSVFQDNDSMQFNRDGLLCAVNLQTAYFTTALIYNSHQPKGFVNLIDCPKYIYKFRKSIFKTNNFEYYDISKSDYKCYKALLNRIIDIKADMLFRINNIVHTIFYLKDNELFAIRYKLEKDDLKIGEYKYDYFVHNVLTKNEFVFLDWYQSDNFEL